MVVEVFENRTHIVWHSLSRACLLCTWRCLSISVGDHRYFLSLYPAAAAADWNDSIWTSCTASTNVELMLSMLSSCRHGRLTVRPDPKYEVVVGWSTPRTGELSRSVGLSLRKQKSLKLDAVEMEWMTRRLFDSGECCCHSVGVLLSG